MITKHLFLRSAAVVGLFVSVSVCLAAENIAGRWEGSVQIPDRGLALIVDLAQDNGGRWMGSVIMPGFGVKGAQLTEIKIANSRVSFSITLRRGFGATLKGNFNTDGTLAGDFVEAGNHAPFVLKKTGPPQVELPPRSTSITREMEGEWVGEYEMFGSPRKVTMKLVNRGADGAAADFVIVGKKTNNLPVDLITQEGDSVMIDSHETGISYEGRLNKEAREIKGVVIQGAIELPLVLHRAK